MRKVTQKCFDKNLLYIYNNNYENNTLVTEEKKKFLDKDLVNYKFFLPSKKTDIYVVTAQLPENVTCKHCVLQWKYHGGNNFGVVSNETGNGCLGCVNRQEEFYNCADIEILKESEYLSLEKLNLLKPLASELNKTKNWATATVPTTTTVLACTSEPKESEISNLTKNEKILKILEKLLEVFSSNSTIF